MSSSPPRPSPPRRNQNRRRSSRPDGSLRSNHRRKTSGGSVSSMRYRRQWYAAYDDRHYPNGRGGYTLQPELQVYAPLPQKERSGAVNMIPQAVNVYVVGDGVALFTTSRYTPYDEGQPGATVPYMGSHQAHQIKDEPRPPGGESSHHPHGSRRGNKSYQDQKKGNDDGRALKKHKVPRSRKDKISVPTAKSFPPLSTSSTSSHFPENPSMPPRDSQEDAKETSSRRVGTTKNVGKGRSGNTTRKAKTEVSDSQRSERPKKLKWAAIAQGVQRTRRMTNAVSAKPKSKLASKVDVVKPQAKPSRERSPVKSPPSLSRSSSIASSNSMISAASKNSSVLRANSVNTVVPAVCKQDLEVKSTGLVAKNQKAPTAQEKSKKLEVSASDIKSATPKSEDSATPKSEDSATPKSEHSATPKSEHSATPKSEHSTKPCEPMEPKAPVSSPINVEPSPSAVEPSPTNVEPLPAPSPSQSHGVQRWEIVESMREHTSEMEANINECQNVVSKKSTKSDSKKKHDLPAASIHLEKKSSSGKATSKQPVAQAKGAASANRRKPANSTSTASYSVKERRKHSSRRGPKASPGGGSAQGGQKRAQKDKSSRPRRIPSSSSTLDSFADGWLEHISTKPVGVWGGMFITVLVAVAMTMDSDVGRILLDSHSTALTTPTPSPILFSSPGVETTVNVDSGNRGAVGVGEVSRMLQSQVTELNTEHSDLQASYLAHRQENTYLREWFQRMHAEALQFVPAYKDAYTALNQQLLPESSDGGAMQTVGQAYTVIIPHGVAPGSEFEVQVQEAVYVVTCPQNGKPGQIMAFDVPETDFFADVSQKTDLVPNILSSGGTVIQPQTLGSNLTKKVSNPNVTTP